MVEIHDAVLVIVAHGRLGAVHWQMIEIVRPQAMGLRLVVRNETPLQQSVLGRLDGTWEVVTGAERGLLGELVEVSWHSVENEVTYLPERESLLRPFLGRVERVKFEAVELVRPHGLNLEVPRREIPAANGIVKVARGMAEIAALNLGRFGDSEILHTLAREPAELDVGHLFLGVDQFVRVHAVAIHEAVGLGGSRGPNRRR